MSTELSGIGLRLREIRKTNDLTQQVMAAAIDVTDRTYKNYEQEKRDLPAAAAITICDAFGVSLEWLLAGRGKARSSDNPELAEISAKAVLLENASRQTELPIEKLCKIIGFVASQAVQSGDAPTELATKYFDTL